MASVPLPERPNVAQLDEFVREHQRETGFTADVAQREVAEYFGFATWDRLREHVQAIESLTWSPGDVPADEPDAHRFLRLTVVAYDDGPGPDLHTARQLLDSSPALVATDLAVAAVCGGVDSLRRLVGRDVDRPTGPFGWPALMYVAYSRLDVGEAATRAVARVLLDAGADPNGGRYFLGYPTPFTVLTGVFGDGEGSQPVHPHAPALARLLLAAGSDPNDAQTLYNRQFATADDFLEVLFEYGLGTGDGGPWRRRLPDLSDSPPEMVRGLLDWAVSHGQRDRVALLAGHGVDVLTPIEPGGPTPIATALANGHRDVAEVLRSHGAVMPEQTPAKAYVGAVLAGDRAAVAAADPAVVASVRAERPGLIVWAAAQGRLAGVAMLADAGFDLDVLARGDVPAEQPWQTALHSAIEHGHDEVVALLVRLGARRDIPDARFGGTATDWARHFGREHLLPVLEAG